jgi:L-2-hydroxyglutarate oxidase
MPNADVVIVGGGIVGLATAYQLSRLQPDKKILLLEKEAVLAAHQTGRNSGVLHSGIYYRPGSLRAQNCQAGKRAMEAFCQAENVPYEICGKVIVAVNESEFPALERIYERGQANGVRCERIGRERLQELEPHTAGLQAIHVPETGIVDYPAVCFCLGQKLVEAGGQILFNTRFTGLLRHSEGLIVKTTAGEFFCEYLVNCAGLYADRVARFTGQQFKEQIVPFRGEYYELKPEAQYLCRNLIYPVPDPNFPFLGVHFTRLIHGGVECGPNAVLAFAREGYLKRNISFRDLAETLTYPGFIRLALRYWRTGLAEMVRSFSRRAFVRALQRLVPEIRKEHLEVAPSGVRAQAVTRDGQVYDDFWLMETDRVVNVFNAPSPAATAALNVGRLVVEELAQRWS